MREGWSSSATPVENAGNNGILIWRSHRADDGTLVADNRIEAIDAKDGGSGQNGNAINVFRLATGSFAAIAFVLQRSRRSAHTAPRICRSSATAARIWVKHSLRSSASKAR